MKINIVGQIPGYNKTETHKKLRAVERIMSTLRSGRISKVYGQVDESLGKCQSIQDYCLLAKNEKFRENQTAVDESALKDLAVKWVAPQLERLVNQEV